MTTKSKKDESSESADNAATTSNDAANPADTSGVSTPDTSAEFSLDDADEKATRMSSHALYHSLRTERNYQIVAGAVALLIVALVVMVFHNIKVKTDLEAVTTEKAEVTTVLTSTQKNLKEMTAAHQSEKVKITETEKTLQETKQALEGQIADLESALQNVRSKVGDLKEDKREAMIELAQFKRFSGQFQRMINAGKLEVVFRHGRMVVNLPAQVLFDSGSAQLTEDGMKALKEVAGVLRTVKNRRFLIAGHTDNRKIKKADFDSNWDLAAARAIKVTEELIKSGMPPKNLVAAGYAQYSPIASNATEAGRQKNRRIEIILEPFLKEVNPPATSAEKEKPAAKGKPKAKKKSR